MHAGDGVVSHFFTFARINDKANAIDGNAGLGDVRTEHTFAHTFRRRVEHSLLLLHAQGTVTGKFFLNIISDSKRDAFG